VPDDLDDDCWLLLHEVRLRGVVDGTDETIEVRVVEAGFAARASKGLRLTPEGRVNHTAWARVRDDDVEAAVERAYQRFLTLNRELIRVCNDWQVRPGGAPNDHVDPTYDWAVVDRLLAIDDRVGPILRSASQQVIRFGAYRPRLRHARQRVNDGDYEWLTSPRIDSYHTVWMQLHEDLLLALGLDRASEE
jgi:FAD/FMN-containing dehydrogenase